MTPEQFREFVAIERWTASTSAQYRKFPHQYAVIERTTDPERFREAIAHIRSHGEIRPFFKAAFIYLSFDGFDYWTMNGSDRWRLINRVPNASGSHHHAPAKPVS